MRPLTYNIWYISIALEVLLAAVLLVKKTWKKFPIFTAYACFNVLEAAVAYALLHNASWYFYSYWICEAIATLLGMGVVYEVFNALFSHHAALRKIAKLLFRIAIVLLILLGCVVIATQPSVQGNTIGSVVMVVAEAARFVELGLLMLLFLFSTAFGLHWRAQVFGIAIGLGVFAAVDLVNVTLRSYFGVAAADILNLARGLAFALSVVLWTIYLFVPERATSSEEVPKRAQLEQWNQAVMELISR